MLQKILMELSVVSAFMGNSGTLGSVLGVLWTICKVVSNEKAGPFVQKLQGAVDAVAKAVALVGQIVLSVGSIIQKMSDDLSDLIKSNGIGGTK